MAAVLWIVSLFLLPQLGFSSGASEEIRTDTFSYDGVARLEVQNAEVYSIEVSGAPGRDLYAEVRAPSDTRVGIEHRRSGDTVMIRAYRKTRLFGWLGGSWGQHRLVLRVPRSCELDIRTSTGSIAVADVNGSKKLRTDTGSVTLRGCDGDTEAETDTGSHEYVELRGNLTAHTDTGRISLAGVEGTLAIDTNTGRIEAVGLVLTGDSSFTADTGSIDIELAQSLDEFSFDLKTDTGGITVGETQARGRLVMGDGRIGVRAQTDTGSVRIQGE